MFSFLPQSVNIIDSNCAYFNYSDNPDINITELTKFYSNIIGDANYTDVNSLNNLKLYANTMTTISYISNINQYFANLTIIFTGAYSTTTNNYAITSSYNDITTNDNISMYIELTYDDNSTETKHMLTQKLYPVIINTVNCYYTTNINKIIKSIKVNAISTFEISQLDMIRDTNYAHSYVYILNV